ncbi:MAG TPA: thioredoxin domain-containing protein [Bryobacteraceae bacterium]
MADLERKQAKALFQARTAYYDAERRAIEELVDSYLLEQQARKEGVSVDELLDRHVNKTLPKDPTEEALKVYYEGVDTTEPYEAVREKIVTSLRQRRAAKAKAAYVASLRREMPIVLRLPPPRAPLSMQGARVRGPANARVTLLEYADFECPYCQQIEPIVEKLAKEYDGVLAFAFKDYPLPMHASAQKAAEASRCADAQGKFWEYHDLLFKNKQLDIAALKADARNLNLDGAAFDKCLDTGAMQGAVETDLSEAQALSLQGTPSFFVNGRAINGALSYEKMRTVIAEELSAVENQSAARVADSTGTGSGRSKPH